jgi:hypothetical protein
MPKSKYVGGQNMALNIWETKIRKDKESQQDGTQVKNMNPFDREPTLTKQMSVIGMGPPQHNNGRRPSYLS